MCAHPVLTTCVLGSNVGCYIFEHASGCVCGCARACLDELANLTARARGRSHRLAAGEAPRLGARYREASADLAYARRRFGDDAVTRRVEALVVRARPLVYGPSARRIAARSLAHGYWQAIAERPWPLLAAGR